MNAKRKIFDNQGLHIFRFKQGVKIINLDKNNFSLIKNTQRSLVDILELPLSIYLLNRESRLENCNTVILELLNVDSMKAVYGKNVLDFFKDKSSQAIIRNDQKVIYYQKKLFFDEQTSIKDGLPIDSISIKLPWYNEANEIVGLMGFSAIIGQHSLADFLAIISSLGIVNQGNKLPAYIPGIQLGGIYLTKREGEVLHYIIRGKSSRLIGEALAISERTVHSHIENIKNKMGVLNKAELIEKTFDHIQFVLK